MAWSARVPEGATVVARRRPDRLLDVARRVPELRTRAKGPLDQPRELPRALDGREVTDAVDGGQGDVGEELPQTVRPCPRKERIVFGPEHQGRRGDAVLGFGRLLGQRGGDRARAARYHPIDAENAPGEE